jgi:hypothetical protein
MSTSRLKLHLAICALSLAVGGVSVYGAGGDAGFGGGGSFYLDRTFTASAGTAEVGFEPGFAASGWVGQNIGQVIGGELRYTFERNTMRLESGAEKYTFSGRSHAIYYDLLFHAAPTDAKVRPFVAVGGGVKGFQGTGAEVADQPGQEIVILTKTNDWKGLVVFGGGVKFAFSDRMQFRVEFYDFFSQAPDKVIAPGPGAESGGWLHNLVPSVGVSFTF